MEEQQENQEQPIQINVSSTLETESLTAKVQELILQVENLQRENDHLTRERYVFHNSEGARREKSFAAFGQIPYLLDWVESIAEDVAKLRSEDYLDSQDVDNAIDEFIGDADLISQSDIESLIEFAIDEAKEESQSIATDKISEIFEEKVLEIDWSVTPRF
jgi:hypothetical protein